MEFKKVAVIGAGIMGTGIAQVCAQKGFSVYLQDVSDEVLEMAIGSITKSLKKSVEKDKISQKDMDDVLLNIKTTLGLEEAVKNADLIIEAIIEDLGTKIELFEKADKLSPGSAIIASNTSALPITAMAAATNRPQQVIGLHFMNPVPLMQGVEVISGMDTSEGVLKAVMQFVKQLGKEPAHAVDYGGFIVSRLLDSMLNEAAYCVMDGNEPKEIDKAMKLCANLPMGPCELADLVGIDIVYRGLLTLEQEFGSRFKVSPLIRKMVRAGHLGRKSGKGFYDYSNRGDR